MRFPIAASLGLIAGLTGPVKADIQKGYVAIDLDPTGYDGSFGLGASDSVVAGSVIYTIPAPTVVRSTYAATWSGPNDTLTILNPAGFYGSQCNASSAGTQVGWGMAVANGFSHALLWSGSAVSLVDLNPSGYQMSVGNAALCNVQAGYAEVTGGSVLHAMKWNGTAASAVDLHPAGFYSSMATAVGPGYVAGAASGSPIDGFNHAMIWPTDGSAPIDLRPSSGKFSSTFVWAASGNLQAGYGQIDSPNAEHALIWHGTANSAVDLTPIPSTYSLSWAYAASGNVQAGYAAGPATSNSMHAAMWRGTAGSIVDLNQFLPSKYNAYSEALAVDPSGDIIGTAAGSPSGYPGVAFFVHAILWRPQVRLIFSAPSSVQPGEPFDYSIKAQDPNGQTVTSYNGTVHFTSTDRGGVLPTDVALVNGLGTFHAILISPGVQLITAVDVDVNGPQGGSPSILVAAPPVVTSVSLSPNRITGGLTSEGTVTLSAPAPAGGVDVTLSTNRAAVASPSVATVNIPEGASEATFDVSTMPVGSIKGAVIGAALEGPFRRLRSWRCRFTRYRFNLRRTP